MGEFYFVYSSEFIFFSAYWYTFVHFCSIADSIARNEVALVLTWCYETTDLNQLIGIEIEEANQSSIFQYNREMNFKEDLIRNPWKSRFRVKNYFIWWNIQMWKWFVIVSISNELWSVFERTSFWRCHVEIFSDGFQHFHFVLQ